MSINLCKRTKNTCLKITCKESAEWKIFYHRHTAMGMYAFNFSQICQNKKKNEIIFKNINQIDVKKKSMNLNFIAWISKIFIDVKCIFREGKWLSSKMKVASTVKIYNPFNLSKKNFPSLFTNLTLSQFHSGSSFIVHIKYSWFVHDFFFSLLVLWINFFYIFHFIHVSRHKFSIFIILFDCCCARQYSTDNKASARHFFYTVL